MSVENKTLLYNLLGDLSKSKLKEFKNYSSGNLEHLEIIKLYENFTTKITDDFLLNTFEPKISIQELEQIKESLLATLLSFLHNSFFQENSKEYLKKELEISAVLCSYGYNNNGLVKIKEFKELDKNMNHFDVVNIALDYLIKYDDSYRLNIHKAIEIEKEIKTNIELQANLYSYTNLSLQIYTLQNVPNIENDIINKYVKHPLLQDKSKPKSIMARYYYYMALMDSYSFLNKNNNKRLEVVNNAVAYFKGILKTNEYYFPKYLFLLERKAHSEILLEDYKELKRTIDTLFQIEIPEKFNTNPTFAFQLESMRLKYLFSYSINLDKEKAFELLQNDYKKIVVNKLSSIGDTQHNYYTMIFNYAVKFNNYQEVINTSKDFFKFFKENHSSLNPGKTTIMQIAICTFLSAYKIYSKEEFIEFVEQHIISDNEALFDKDNGEYHYINKMSEHILDVYETGFFNENNFNNYIKLWSFKPEIHNKVVCISQNILHNEYNKSKNENWNNKYKELCF